MSDTTSRTGDGHPPAHRRAGGGETVLVVEDDPVVQKLTRDLLETLGYRPLCADNGRDALELIDSGTEEIRIVLSDVVMPKMGGSELLDELRKRNEPVKVILMSGYEPGLDSQSDTADPPEAWLHKPFSLDDLDSVLADVLGSAGPSAKLSA